MNLVCKQPFVGDGEEACHLLQNEDSQFDLLLTDCHMPKMDGFALARFVKNHIPQERYKWLSVVR
nr:response regulator [Vibrio anguillarum]